MKPFFGYNSKEEAEKFWGKEILDAGKKTTKKIGVVKDSTKWPQEISHYEILTRIELTNAIVSY